MVILILNAISKFTDSQFQSHLGVFYAPVIKLLIHEMPQDIRLATFQVLHRSGKQMGLIKEDDSNTFKITDDNEKNPTQEKEDEAV